MIGCDVYVKQHLICSIRTIYQNLIDTYKLEKHRKQKYLQSSIF